MRCFIKDKRTYCLIKSKTIQNVGDAINNRIITINMENNEKNQLTQKNEKVFGNTKPGNCNLRNKKEDINSPKALLKRR